MRIQLKSGLPMVRRGPSTVQFGLDARHGTVLDGLDEDDVELLHELATGLDDGPLLGPLPAGPVEADRARRLRRLVAALAGTGVLLRSRTGRAALSRLGELRTRLAPDAATWSLVHPRAGDGWELLSARRHRRVEIRGSGRTGTVLAASLAAAGVGEVVVDDARPVTHRDLAPGGAVPDDVGAPRGVAARRAVRRALGRTTPGSDEPDGDPGHDPGGDPERGPGGDPGCRPGRGPDLVVLVDRGAADATRADQLLATDVPHLSVVVHETSVLVGPLVLPGRGPCLRCLDLHRSERDHGWPLVLAQLLGRRAGRAGPFEETALAQLAAALAALQILAQLDGQVVPAAVGATLEVELPDGLISRRPWPAHAACGCHWPPPPGGKPGIDAESPGQDGRFSPGPATMPA